MSAFIFKPLAVLLNVLSRLMAKVTGSDKQDKPSVTEEELKYIDAGASFMPTYLPEGLEMGSTEQGRYSYAVTYENPKDPAQWIVFRQVTAAQQLVIQVDTENADSVRWLPIGQSEAMVVVKDGCTQVVWRVGDVFLSVVAEQIPQEEALAFAYGISEI